MKKILLLGGSRYLRPVIKAIHELGYYAITCDYLPDNYAHGISDEYHNVSIIDKDAVLELALKLNIDGIMSFACDPGVVTAAYVAEKMNLPTSPLESVEILQNKGKFRKFLYDNGFNVPKAKSYISVEKALEEIDNYTLPVIVKPVDSAGSKGVKKVDKVHDLRGAIEEAIKVSFSSEFIIEEFIEKKGDSSDTEAFSVNGELVFLSFNNQIFDNTSSNCYTPAAFSWPSNMCLEVQKELKSELQRLIKLLHMDTSIYNIETRVGLDEKAYIMEVSPRGGGNRLAEVLEYSTGIELIKNAVRAAVGEPINLADNMTYDGFWCEIILHSNKNGFFDSIEIADEIKKYIYQIDLWVVKGDKVNSFASANFSIGTAIFKFDKKKLMEKFLKDIEKYLIVNISN